MPSKRPRCCSSILSCHLSLSPIVCNDVINLADGALLAMLIFPFPLEPSLMQTLSKCKFRKPKNPNKPGNGKSIYTHPPSYVPPPLDN